MAQKFIERGKMKYKFRTAEKVKIISISIYQRPSIVKPYLNKKMFITQRKHGRVGNEYELTNSKDESIAWIYENQLESLEKTK